MNIAFLIFFIIILCVIGYTVRKIIEASKSRIQDLSNTVGRLQEALINERESNSKFMQDYKNNLEELTTALIKERENNATLLSQKKSSETRIGQISEHLIPFLSEFTHDVQNVRFLGSPVDMIAFDFEEPSIYFIEVKTGKSKESHRQRLIKNAIKAGRVYYEKITIGTKEIKTKLEENIE